MFTQISISYLLKVAMALLAAGAAETLGCAAPAVARKQLPLKNRI
jgi:hypothetical protein